MTLNQYCLLSLSTEDCANYYFSSFTYWHEIKGLQMLPFELGCADWRKYAFLDVWHRQTHTHRHVTEDQFSTVSLWRVTLFSRLHSSIISVVDSECHGEKKWHWRSLDWWSHHFLDKSSPEHKSEVFSCKNWNFYLQTTLVKGKNGDGCTGEKTIHAEIYILRHLERQTLIFCF